MIICKLCESSVSMPYRLKCGHIFCILCLKTFIRNGKSECVQCNTFIMSDLISSVKIRDLYNFNVGDNKVFWLYSSNYPKYWWCYDTKSTSQIEHIYKDYLERKKLYTKITPNSNVDIKINLNNDEASEDIDMSTSLIDIVLPEDNKVLKNLIDFTGTEDELSEESNGGDVFPELSYIISIGKFKYKIDFDQMKQISVINSKKKRNLYRIEIKEKVKNIESHLKNKYNILGISGINF